jgi:hypothetical protein
MVGFEDTGSILEESKLVKIRENSEDEVNVIGIKQATKKGYIECELPGCADFSFPNSTKRRGRVQGGGQIVPTLTAAEGIDIKVSEAITKDINISDKFFFFIIFLLYFNRIIV